MRSSLWRWMSVALVLAVAALGAAACGDDQDESGGGGSDASSQEGSPAAKTGGEFRVLETSFPDFVDPALTYTVEGIQIITTTHNGLLTYQRKPGAEGAKLMPALAEALPKISADGRTYTLTLREGLKYSDGSAVKAGDFEHAIKRVLNLESGGASFYTGIEGADQYLERGRARGDISGIETDEATREITISLEEPDGRFPFILAMWFASLVPSDTPFENQTREPPPGVGQFRIADVDSSRRVTLERNPNLPDIPGLPAAKPDRVTIDIVKNQRRQFQDVLRGDADFLQDPAVADQVAAFRRRAPEQIRDDITNSTYYYFLNVREKPFDDKRVRQAVNFAVDKRALARIYGGQLAPACNFLPPGMQGYRKIDPCPYGDPNAAPNVARARELVRQAGATGQKVTVFGNDETPSRPFTEYLADVLNDIGLDAEPRIVEGSVYFATVGNARTRAQAGFANWFQDFPHPANFLFLVDGDSIQPTNSQNFGNVKDPQIDRQLDELNQNANLAETAPGYAAIDRRVVEEAYVVPYGHRRLPTVVSERVKLDSVLFHPVNQVDYTTFSLK